VSFLPLNADVRFEHGLLFLANVSQSDSLTCQLLLERARKKRSIRECNSGDSICEMFRRESGANRRRGRGRSPPGDLPSPISFLADFRDYRATATASAILRCPIVAKERGRFERSHEKGKRGTETHTERGTDAIGRSLLPKLANAIFAYGERVMKYTSEMNFEQSTR